PEERYGNPGHHVGAEDRGLEERAQPGAIVEEHGEGQPPCLRKRDHSYGVLGGVDDDLPELAGGERAIVRGAHPPGRHHQVPLVQADPGRVRDRVEIDEGEDQQRRRGQSIAQPRLRTDPSTAAWRGTRWPWSPRPASLLPMS